MRTESPLGKTLTHWNARVNLLMFIYKQPSDSADIAVYSLKLSWCCSHLLLHWFNHLLKVTFLRYKLHFRLHVDTEGGKTAEWRRVLTAWMDAQEDNHSPLPFAPFMKQSESAEYLQSFCGLHSTPFKETNLIAKSIKRNLGIPVWTFVPSNESS